MSSPGPLEEVIKMIQALIRGFLTRRKILKATRRAYSIYIQALTRGFLARRRFDPVRLRIRRAWAAFRRYVRSLIRTFRINIQTLMPVSILGERRLLSEQQRFNYRAYNMGAVLGSFNDPQGNADTTVPPLRFEYQENINRNTRTQQIGSLFTRLP